MHYLPGALYAPRISRAFCRTLVTSSGVIRRADGPGVMVIFDVPDPAMAPSIAGIVMAGGGVHNLKLTRQGCHQPFGCRLIAGMMPVAT
jgi:hypothetical protein